jgi:hypothetical protein
MAQSAWLGSAGADIDSATRYDDPQDGQAQSDIFIAHSIRLRSFAKAHIVLDQCDISWESFVRAASLIGIVKLTAATHAANDPKCKAALHRWREPQLF